MEYLKDGLGYVYKSIKKYQEENFCKRIEKLLKKYSQLDLDSEEEFEITKELGTLFRRLDEKRFNIIRDDINNNDFSIHLTEVSKKIDDQFIITNKSSGKSYYSIPYLKDKSNEINHNPDVLLEFKEYIEKL